jgi:hypothetical protein
MNLILDNASLLTLSYDFKLLGDNFNYRNEKKLGIEGEYFTNDGNGVSGILSGVSGELMAVHDYQNIILNGISFGSGRVESVDFVKGNDVRRKKYNASITVCESGNLSNLTGANYSGLSGLSVIDLRNLESLTETFSFSCDESQIYNYDRSVNIQLESGIGSAPVTAAKTLAQFLFQNSVVFPFINSQYPNFYSSGKKFHKETYNLTKGQFDFSERFKFQSSTGYIWTYSTASRFSERESVITEKGEIEGINFNDYTDAVAAYTGTIITGAFGRCSGNYATYIGTGCSLLNLVTDQQINVNKILGTVEYSVSFSDNPRNQTGCIWEYSLSSTKDQDGSYVVSEDGSIKGLGRKTYPTNQQHTRAFQFYSGVKTGVATRVSGLFTGNALTSGSCLSGLHLKESSVTDSEFNGAINYGFRFDTSNILVSGSGIKYLAVSHKDDAPTPLFSTFSILNDTQFVAPVFQGNSSLGKFSTQVKGRGTSGISYLYQYYQAAKQRMVTPTGEAFLTDISFAYNSKNGEFNGDFLQSYVEYKPIEDFSP